MKLKTHLNHFFAFVFLSLGLMWGVAFHGSAATLLDDTWATAVRTNQNLPTQSAWFTTSAANLAVYTNALSFTNIGSSSQWVTYFTEAGSPTRLGVGSTLTVELSFKVLGVATANSGQNLRIGLFDSSAGTRLGPPGTDGTISGVGLTGYALFIRFNETWLNNGGLDHRKRRADAIGGSDLMGSSATYDSLGSGGTVNPSPGFSNDVPYKITISYTRMDVNSNLLSVVLSGGALTNTWTVGDPGVTAGTTLIYTNFDTLDIRPSAASSTANNFIFTELKITGPTGSPDAPGVTSQPVNQSVETAETAVFTGAAGGGQPLAYQWYFNDDSTPVPNATNSTLLLRDVQGANEGSYFFIVTNSLGAATSSVATLTVETPTFTGHGLVVDDLWADGARSDPPVTESNSVWYAADTASLTASVGSMLAFPTTNTARFWIGYYTEDGGPSVDLAIGDAIRLTAVFTPTNPAAQNSANLRMGLFDYSNGGTRLTADSSTAPFSTGNAVKVRGYMLTVNMGQTFGDGTPLEFFVKNNFASVDLLGAVGNYASIGSGPNGSLNAPAFSNGVPYTLQITISRIAQAQMRCEAKITGPSLNITHSAIETNYNYRRYDSFAIRANRTTDSAEVINFSELKVEVISAPTLPSFRITAIAHQDETNAIITWESVSGRSYQVQSRDALGTGSWTTNATVTATSASTSYTDSPIPTACILCQRYYRVVGLP